MGTYTHKVEAEIIGGGKYMVRVYRVYEDGSFGFLGKAITNDVLHAADTIINEKKAVTAYEFN